jgi:hypothetical protein
VQKLGVCFGSGEVPNNGLESWKTVPPGRMASLTFAERSIGLPTTPNIESAYKVPLQQTEINAAVSAKRVAVGPDFHPRLLYRPTDQT